MENKKLMNEYNIPFIKEEGIGTVIYVSKNTKCITSRS